MPNLGVLDQTVQTYVSENQQIGDHWGHKKVISVAREADGIVQQGWSSG